jgi:hypothetical protein
MGIYDDVVVEDFPQLLPKICLAIFFKKIKVKLTSIQVSLKNPKGESIILPDIKPPHTLKVGENYNVDVFVVPLKIEKAGKFLWEIRFNGENKPSYIHEMLIRTTEKKQ